LIFKNKIDQQRRHELYRSKWKHNLQPKHWISYTAYGKKTTKLRGTDSNIGVSWRSKKAEPEMATNNKPPCSSINMVSRAAYKTHILKNKIKKKSPLYLKIPVSKNF